MRLLREAAGGANHLDWTEALPDGWQVKPLRAVADSMVSNVDKLVSDDEIRLSSNECG